MKRIALIFAALFMFSSLSGQINIGADYYYLGEYENAQDVLEKEVPANPADANFYLGEIAFAQGDLKKAEGYYDKALAADPGHLQAQVGKIKLSMKSDPQKAENEIKALLKQHKKNATLAVAIGRAYLDNDMPDKARAMAEEAQRFDKKYPATYILGGDIIMSNEDSDTGLATKEYEQAKYFDPDYMLAYMKLAHIYERRNLSIALDNLKAATDRNPDYVIADGMLGKIYTTHGRYPEAIAALSRYFQKAEPTTAGIERMARAYYFGEPERLGMDEAKKYAEADKWITAGLAKNPDHFVLNRYRMYLDASTGNIEEGLAHAEKFFRLRDSDSTYIPMDYIMYGDLLKGADRVIDAIAQYDLAISINPEKLETYDKAANMAREIKHYGLAAEYYDRLIEQKKKLDPQAYENDKLVDINMLGTLYYQAGTAGAKNEELMNELMNDAEWQQRILDAKLGAQKDSLASAKYFATYYGKYNLHKAEDAFRQIMELAPGSYTGCHYMARIQNALYPGQEGIDKGTVKQYFEQTIDVIDSRGNADMTPMMSRAYKEALGYLSYYYYMTDDTANALLYSGRLLEIEPDNPTAKSIYEDIKSRQ